MKRLGAIVAVAVLLGSSVSSGQTSTGAVREDAKDFAEAIRDATSGSILEEGAQREVPGFGGTSIDATRYLEDPGGLTSAGETQRGDEHYQVVIDPYRPRFDPTEIDLSSAKLVSNDPDAYLGTSVDLGGGAGTCEPLPGTGAGDLTYMESCNDGSQIIDETRTCRPAIVADVRTVTAYKYYVAPTNEYGAPFPRESSFTSYLANGTCRATGRRVYGCTASREVGLTPNKFCDNYYVRELICSQEIPGISGPGFSGGAFVMPITGKHWFEKTTDTTVTAERSDAACQPLENDQDCQYQNDEVCVEGEETRVINGVPVTQPCWAWERSYQCTGTRPASDCGELDARGECEFHHQECLSEDEAGNCTVFDRWYQCIAEDSGVEQPAEFVCSGDLYCIDGECTQVERQASTEFKDAMVAIQTMGELRDDFDPDTLRLFTGENLKCTKKLFGISNCCSGKGVPLITPFVCDSEDRAVDEKDDAGLCHMVGTYCSDKVLGVCVTKKQSYCCFSSKLTRILQEQGREQLGKEWGDPEEPNCDGFLVEEFQSLDLSLMDFSEVYAEFVEAARLPDEIEAGVLIQERIAEYYDLHAGQQ